MKRITLTAIIEREGDGYVSLCPELDVASQGDTKIEARQNLEEAIAGFLETASQTEIAGRLNTSATSRVLRSALPKLRTMSGRDLCQILERHDFVFIRQRGSHRIMQCKVPGTTITVPVPDHRELRIGTMMSIIRQSGLPRSLFEVQ